MGRIFKVELEGDLYSCVHCNTQLALRADIVSRNFRSKHGKAYLLDNVVNITEGEKEERWMTTGMYTLADIFCVQCVSLLGWKYETAQSDTQKYKEGKFVIDRSKVVLSDDATHTDSDDDGSDVASDDA